jgi:accessory gene regulator protein AgrB
MSFDSMALNVGDPVNIDGDPIVKESDVKKWKRRSLILTLISFVVGQALPPLYTLL